MIFQKRALIRHQPYAIHKQNLTPLITPNYNFPNHHSRLLRHPGTRQNTFRSALSSALHVTLQGISLGNIFLPVWQKIFSLGYQLCPGSAYIFFHLMPLNRLGFTKSTLFFAGIYATPHTFFYSSSPSFRHSTHKKFFPKKVPDCCFPIPGSDDSV